MLSQSRAPVGLSVETLVSTGGYVEGEAVINGIYFLRMPIKSTRRLSHQSPVF